jgi:hypothetical protein
MKHTHPRDDACIDEQAVYEFVIDVGQVFGAMVHAARSFSTWLLLH